MSDVVLKAGRPKAPFYGDWNGEVSNADGVIGAAGVFPEIFDRLHEGEGGEESVRRRTRAEIGTSDTLVWHFSAVAESMIAIDRFARVYVVVIAHPVSGNGCPSRARRMAVRASMARRLAVSTTERRLA
jgi:hypothetical protein